MYGNFTEFLFGMIQTHAYAVPFLGALLGGEETILVITTFSAQGFIPFWTVAIFSFLGTIVSDTLWFFAGKTPLYGKFISHRSFKNGYRKLVKTMDTVFRGNYFMALLATKFLYGARIITIMYISKKDISFFLFTMYNSLTTIIWLFVILTIGWFAGKGISVLLRMTENLQLVVIVVIGFIAAFYILRIWINKLIAKRQDQ